MVYLCAEDEVEAKVMDTALKTSGPIPFLLVYKATATDEGHYETAIREEVRRTTDFEPAGCLPEP